MKRLFLAWLLATSAALAQAPKTNLVVSPEVLPDHRVVFRVSAPRASEVRLTGDWMLPDKTEPMTRDEQGVWSVTAGPLEAGLSIYTFTVDGVTTPDPVNPRIKLRARTSASLVEVRGSTPEPWEPAEVPHGTLEVIWKASKATGDTRAYYVYTPPGYNPSRARSYPVLYLLHGNNDTAAGWTDVGKVNFILDNLIAAKKAVPMIVVMPWGHALPYDGPQTNNTAVFERYLLDEVVPQVEERYRVDFGRTHRAIVGLSMGGGHALQIGLGHLDLFAAVGAFSTAVPSAFESRFQKVLDDPAETNKKLKLLWIGCGRQDPAFGRNEKLSELLTSHQIKHTFYPTEGVHNFAIWRRYLVEVAPLLFREQE
ncbi:MAG TPA: alpha/beta hydrolase-fold protein [Candidatus Limnocylindria bacterium]|nr:alpha/beta hydrolase-fold protein [Candidatus Limnocylindria bacterium]